MAEKRKWDLRGTRHGFEGRRCSLCVGEGIIEHRFRNEKAERMIYTVHSKICYEQNAANSIRITYADLTGIKIRRKYLFAVNLSEVAK